MKQTPEVIEHWIKTIREEAINLSKWEEDFLDSIEEQFGYARSISDKQEEILERIYADKTP